MKLILGYPFALISMLFVLICSLSDCYDSLDPNGKITVTFDIHEWTNDGYVARVTIRNYYSYRHVDKPGWLLGWTWSKNEVIWSMAGAFATQLGNCSMMKYRTPHSCKKDPVIVDLMPETLAENRSDDCCHGGVLAAWAIDPSKSFSSFEMTVGNLGKDSPDMPQNLTLMAPGPGYTCSPLLDTDPTVSSDIGGRREVQVFRTWKSACTYSTFLANKTPMCCVSLSTFYSPTITSCPTCSCGCREANQRTTACIRESYPSAQSKSLSNIDIVQCTNHMCPIRVHWHVKNNYMDHWRVKLTISNYNYKRNYSDWNILVQHPGFSKSTITYSFNSSMLPTVGLSDEIALFWGIEYYNKELLNADEYQLGSVTTDILLKKDLKKFTLRNGAALPRTIYFNGENCVMPPGDTYPMLPNGRSIDKPIGFPFLLILTYLTYHIMAT